MVSLKQLHDELITNDISFSYKDKEYVICPLNKFCVGEAGNDEDNQSFDTFDDMISNWIIEGRPLKDIVDQIKLL